MTSTVNFEPRGHKFCRYTDECNIYVRTKIKGDCIMASLTAFLETRLRLRMIVTRLQRRISWNANLWATLCSPAGNRAARQGHERAPRKLRELTQPN